MLSPETSKTFWVQKSQTDQKAFETSKSPPSTKKQNLSLDPFLCLLLNQTTCDTSNTCSGLITLNVNNQSNTNYSILDDNDNLYTFAAATNTSQQVCNNSTYSSPYGVTVFDNSCNAYDGFSVGQDDNVFVTVNPSGETVSIGGASDSCWSSVSSSTKK